MDRGVANFVAGFEYVLGPAWTPELKEIYLESDMEAFKDVAWAMTEEIDYKAILSASSLPILVYVGEEDEYYARVKEVATWIPESNLTFFSLPGLEHWSGFYRSDLVIPHVRKFLSKLG